MSIPARMKLRASDRPFAVDENTIGKRMLFEKEHAEGKPLLRAVTSRLLPPEVANRAKRGFSALMPAGSAARASTTSTGSCERRTPRIYNYLEPSFVTGVLEDHTSGKHNRRLLIWSLLSVEWWCRLFLDGQRPDERDRSVIRPGARTG